MLNVHCQSVSEWESGQRYPNGKYMVALAKLLDSSVEELFFSEGEDQKSE